jgi:hypothetical protein
VTTVQHECKYIDSDMNNTEVPELVKPESLDGEVRVNVMVKIGMDTDDTKLDVVIATREGHRMTTGRQHSHVFSACLSAGPV